MDEAVGYSYTRICALYFNALPVSTFQTLNNARRTELSDDLLRRALLRALFREFLCFVTVGHAHLAQEAASIVKDEKNR